MKRLLRLIGKIKLIEECETLDLLNGKPLQLFQSFLGSNVKVTVGEYCMIHLVTQNITLRIP